MTDPRFGRPATVVVAGFALFLLALGGLLRLASDNSPEVWFVRGSEAVERDRRLQREYPHRDLVRVLVAGAPDASVPAALELEARAREVPGVETVAGLESLGFANGQGAERVLADARRSPLAAGLGVVGSDERTIGLVIEIADPRGRVPVLEALDRLLLSAPEGVDVALAGLPVLHRALDESSAEIAARFTPALGVFAVGLLLLVLRDVRAVAVALAPVLLAEGTVVGTMGWAGVRWNLVLAILPPVVFVIGLATGLHLLLAYRAARAGSDNAAAAARSAWTSKGWSVLSTGATTAVGFLALVPSPVGPVRDLGLWMALAVAFVTFVTATVTPAFLVLLDPRAAPVRGFEAAGARFGAVCARFAVRRRAVVLLSAGVLAVAALASLPRLAPESNALLYLAEDHPVRAATARAEHAGIGLATVELVARRDEPFAASEIARLERWHDAAELGAPALHRLDAGVLLREARLRAGIDPGPDVLATALAADSRSRALWNAVVGRDRKSLRVLVFVETIGAETLFPASRSWAESLERTLPGTRVEVAGRLPLLLETQDTLLATLGISLAISFGVIGLVLWPLLRSARLWALALPPNLGPVLGILGIMGFAGIPLDLATVMVASVALGLAVDDTIHTLGPFRRLAPELGSRRAVEEVLRRTAGAYLLTALVLASGFGVCALSDFAPTRRFGLLAAGAIGLALVADLLLLPALLSFVGPAAPPATADPPTRSCRPTRNRPRREAESPRPAATPPRR